MLALSAATLIGIQFWYADQGGVYVLWYLPLLLLVVFRPNLADRQPPTIEAETDWLRRWGRKLAGWIGRWLKLQEERETKLEKAVLLARLESSFGRSQSWGSSIRSRI